MGKVLQAVVGKDALSAVVVLIFFPFFFFRGMLVCVCVRARVCLCACLRVPSIGQIQAAAPKILCHQHRGRWWMHNRGGCPSRVGRTLCNARTPQSRAHCSAACISRAPPARAELKSLSWGHSHKVRHSNTEISLWKVLVGWVDHHAGLFRQSDDALIPPCSHTSHTRMAVGCAWGMQTRRKQTGI